jgi:hypothetical protein
MRLEIRQRFAMGEDEVAAAYLNPGLYPCFHTVGKLGDIAVLGVEEVAEGRRARVRVRYRFMGRVPPLATTVVDPRKLSFVEETIYDEGAGSFRIIGDHYPGLLSCTGRIELAPQGHGCVRHVTGELRAHLPLLARPATPVVERSLTSGLGEALAAQVPIVEAFVAGGRS